MKVSNIDLKNEVLELIEELGRVPTLKEYDEKYKHRGMISSRFGNWNNFLLDYVGIKPVQAYYKDRKCKVENCERNAVTNFLCDRHYAQELRHGKILKKGRLEKNKITEKENYAEVEVYNKDGNKKEIVLIDLIDVDKISESCIYTYKGYAIINSIEGKKRLVEFLYGKLKEGEVYSYKNKNSLDCRKDNILIICHSEKSKNNKVQKRNKTGVKGIFKEKSGKYRVSIGHNGKNHYLGIFDDMQDAVDARIKAEEKYWGKVYSKL